MKRIILISMLFLSMTACVIMPSKKTAEYKDISFYYIPNVNIGIGVFSNDTQQTVRVFHNSEQVTERCEGIPESSDKQSTGISFRIDSSMVLSLTDYYRFPKVYLLSGYSEASKIRVRPQYGYVVLGKSMQSYPEGVRYINVSLPVRNDRLEYYDIEGIEYDILPLPRDTLKLRLASTQGTRSYAKSGDFHYFPEFFDNAAPEADLDSQLTLYPDNCCFDYRGTTVKTSPNLHSEGWFYSNGFYINPMVPNYVFTGPFDFFSITGDVPIVISDIVGMVVEYESRPDRIRHPREPWVWIDWKDKKTLCFRQ